MDLGTFTVSGVAAIGWNVLSNSVTAASGISTDALHRRWVTARASIPADDAVLWAVRRSALQATRAACHARLRSLGVLPTTPMSLPWDNAPSAKERERRIGNIPLDQRDAARWLDTVDQALLDDVQSGAESILPPGSADVVFPPSEMPGANVDIDAHARYQLETFLAAMLEELADRFGPVPVDFAEWCRDGGATAGTGRVTWFEAYAAFFRQSYLDDEDVKALLDRSALGQIHHEVQTVGEALRALGGDLAQRLDAVETATRDLRADLRDELQNVLREHRDAILLALAENTSAAPSDVIAPFTRHVLLRQIYQGEEVAVKVERIIREKTEIFAGREYEMKRLDQFVEDNPKGVFVVTAPAGMGKSGLLAEWTRTRHGRLGYVARHFFSIQYPSFTRRTDQALVNLLRQCYAYSARTAAREQDGLDQLAATDIPDGGRNVPGQFARFRKAFTAVPDEPLSASLFGKGGLAERPSFSKHYCVGKFSEQKSAGGQVMFGASIRRLSTRTKRKQIADFQEILSLVRALCHRNEPMSTNVHLCVCIRLYVSGETSSQCEDPRSVPHTPQNRMYCA